MSDKNVFCFQNLLDYMTSVGYHQRIYSLAMTYPRHVISDNPGDTLLDLNITSDIALNIEEKED